MASSADDQLADEILKAADALFLGLGRTSLTRHSAEELLKAAVADIRGRRPPGTTFFTLTTLSHQVRAHLGSMGNVPKRISGRVRGRSSVITVAGLRIRLTAVGPTAQDRGMTDASDQLKLYFILRFDALGAAASVLDTAGRISNAALHQVPASPRDFVGRHDEQDTIRSAIESGSNVCGVHGMPSVGKTALITKLSEDLANRYPDGQFFIDLRGNSSEALSANAVMAHIVRSFYPTTQLPADSAGLPGFYTSILHDKQVLLMLDNALDAAQLSPLIPPQQNALLLFTSRQYFVLPGEAVIHLKPLTPDEAILLFKRIAKTPVSDNDDVAAVAEMCGYLPLAVRGAASVVAETPWLTVADSKERLRDIHTRLRLVDPTTNVSVQGSFELSYAMLSATAKRRFAMLSIFPDSFDAEAAYAVWGVRDEETFAKLYALNLVEHTVRTSRCRLHDLLRDFAAVKVSSDDREAGRRRHAEHFEERGAQLDRMYYKGGADAHTAVTLFDSEWANINLGYSWAAEHAPHDSEAKRLLSRYPDSIHLCLDLRQPARFRIGWLEPAAQAAQDLEARSLHAKHLIRLARAHHDIGESIVAVDLAESGLKAAESDERTQALAHFTLAVIRRSIGDYRQMFRHCYAATKLARGDARITSGAMGVRASSYVDFGYVRRAIRLFERRLEIAQDLGDQMGIGNTTGNLGWAHVLIGEADEALPYLDIQLAITRQIGDLRGQCNALGNRGFALYLKGDAAAAISTYEEELEIAAKIHYRSEILSARMRHALARSARGEHNAATADLQLLIEAEGTTPHAQLLGALSVAHYRAGNYEACLQAASEQLTSSADWNHLNRADALWITSLSQFALGALPPAVAAAAEAALILERLEDPRASQVRALLQHFQ